MPRGAHGAGLLIAGSSRDIEHAIAPSLRAAIHADGFAITVRRGWTRIEALGGRGALFGVYRYLQMLGVRFFAPRLPYYRGVGSELVPAHPRRLAPTRLVTSPAFAIRRVDVITGGSNRSLLALVDWAAKPGLNTVLVPLPGLAQRPGHDWATWRHRVLPALRRRGLQLEGGSDYSQRLPYRRLHVAHPAWFSGRRLANAFCASSSGALRAYVRSVINLLRRFPEVRRFDAWPPDNTHWCPRDLRRIGAPAEIQAKILRRLDGRVRAAGLRAQMETVAYSQSKTLEPPRGGLPRRLQMDFAPYNRSYAAPLWSPANRAYWSALLRWRKLAPNLGLYSYYIKGTWHSRPVLLPHLISVELRRLKRLGLNAVSSYGDFGSWTTYEINHLAAAHFAWDPAASYKRFARDYARSRFGSRAGPSILTYLHETEAGGRALFVNSLGGFRSTGDLRTALAHWTLAARALDGASPFLAARPAQLAERLELSLLLGLTDARTAALQLHDQPALALERQAEHITRAAAGQGLLQGIVPNTDLTGDPYLTGP